MCVHALYEGYGKGAKKNVRNAPENLWRFIWN